MLEIVGIAVGVGVVGAIFMAATKPRAPLTPEEIERRKLRALERIAMASSISAASSVIANNQQQRDAFHQGIENARKQTIRFEYPTQSR